LVSQSNDLELRGNRPRLSHHCASIKVTSLVKGGQLRPTRPHYGPVGGGTKISSIGDQKANGRKGETQKNGQGKRGGPSRAKEGMWN